MRQSEYNLIKQIANEYLDIADIFVADEHKSSDIVELPKQWIEEALIEAYRAGKGDILK